MDETSDVKQYASLLDILNYRESVYDSLTETAFHSIKQRLSEAMVMLSKNPNPISWVQIEKYNAVDGFVIVAGYTSPLIGTMVSVGGDELIEVTAENATKFRQVLRFTVPMNMLENGTTTQLYTFIRDMAAIVNLAPSHDLEELLREYNSSNMQELTKLVKYTKILDNATKPTDVFGFDGSQLSDEQITKMHIYKGCGTERAN